MCVTHVALVLTLSHSISHTAEEEEEEEEEDKKEGVEIKTVRRLKENVSGCIRIRDVRVCVCVQRLA